MAFSRVRAGLRRGDHRLWLALLGAVIAAVAVIAIIKLEFPPHDGSVHEMVTPARITQLNARSVSDVKTAVYEYGNSAAGSTEQIMMFIGGHLANAAPATSITDFTQKFTGATSVMRTVRPDLEIVVKN